ncbi:MAG: MNIO family bufferin maturase [Candidatus Binataceae bacterium]
MKRSDFPFLGFGAGLRRPHYGHILAEHPPMDWFEVISENFMAPGGRPLKVLEAVRERYPIVLHGVSMSIGSTDPLNRGYIRQLAALARRFEPAWISDHLCWTGVGGHNLHDLIPLPYTDEAVMHVARRVREVQETLQRTILLENVSSYIEFAHSTLSEWEFLTAVAEEADCAILLDINNIYVSAFNHRFDPLRYINSVPVERVAQFHLAGHSDHGAYLLDTHDHPVCGEVWTLYEYALRRFGTVPALIEWDDNIPEFAVLAAAAGEARRRHNAIIGADITVDSPGAAPSIGEPRR